MSSRRLAMATAAIVAAIGALYFWTAATSPDPGRSYHSLLAEAFQHGETSLPIAPSPELLALPDPYDPAQNAPYRVHDATLFEGKYYIYFGPAPAALLFLPLRALGIDVDDRVAAPLFALGGFGLSAVLLLFLIARYVPRTPMSWRLLAVAGLGLGNVVPFLLRRPAVYETSIAAGLFFMMAAALLLLAGALRERPSVRMIALGSLALGLAVASRSSMVFGVLLLAWAWWRALGPRAGWRRSAVLHWTAAAAVPVGSCLALLALYNGVRFGSITEFGTNYQLAGVNTRTFDYFSLDRLVPGAWFYLLQPPQFALDFPFVLLRPEYPATLPKGFFVEPVAGILPVTPLLFAVLAVPLLAARHRGPDTHEMLHLGVVLLVVAFALPLVPVVSLGGATERYQVDFATLMVLVATIAWLWAADSVRSARWVRRTLLATGAAAIAYCGIANLAFSMVGYYDGLRSAQPATYARLEGAFAWIPTLASKIRGEPVLLEVAPLGVSSGQTWIQLATPGPGVVTFTADFLPTTPIPAGARIALVTESEGRRRMFAVRPGSAPVSAEVDGSGLKWVRFALSVPRDGAPSAAAEATPAGLVVASPRVTGWEPE